MLFQNLIHCFEIFPHFSSNGHHRRLKTHEIKGFFLEVIYEKIIGEQNKSSNVKKEIIDTWVSSWNSSNTTKQEQKNKKFLMP